MIDKKSLNKLKKGLGRNQIRVAKETGFSTATVSQVLDGKFFNEAIINKCIEIKNQRIAANEKIKELI